jgi:prolyl-tRNA synthetase
MKDAYSFDASPAGMQASYSVMYDAYCRIFDACGLSYTPVEAEAGAIGGEVNHEFMVRSAIGEDYFVQCESCGYAANTEAAVSGDRWVDRPVPPEALEEHHTPDRPGIDLVVSHFVRELGRDLTASGMLKCIALVDSTEGADDDAVVVVLVPGDREVRVPKGMRPFEDADFERHPELIKGYIGP